VRIWVRAQFREELKRHNEQDLITEWKTVEGRVKESPPFCWGKTWVKGGTIDGD
jgi:hypothetical protein